MTVKSYFGYKSCSFIDSTSFASGSAYILLQIQCFIIYHFFECMCLCNSDQPADLMGFKLITRTIVRSSVSSLQLAEFYNVFGNIIIWIRDRYVGTVLLRPIWNNYKRQIQFGSTVSIMPVLDWLQAAQTARG